MWSGANPLKAVLELKEHKTCNCGKRKRDSYAVKTHLEHTRFFFAAFRFRQIGGRAFLFLSTVLRPPTI